MVPVLEMGGPFPVMINCAFGYLHMYDDDGRTGRIPIIICPLDSWPLSVSLKNNNFYTDNKPIGAYSSPGPTIPRNEQLLGISLAFPPFMDGVKTWSPTRAVHVRSTDRN